MLFQDLIKCPSCGSTDTKCFGHFQSKFGKSQRYRCISCGKTFSFSAAQSRYGVKFEYRVRHPLYDQIAAFLIAGKTQREARRTFNATQSTIGRIAGAIKTSIGQPKCECGRDSGHKGHCISRRTKAGRDALKLMVASSKISEACKNI